MSSQKTIALNGLEFANDKPMALFGGMNVLESRDMPCKWPKPTRK